MSDVPDAAYTDGHARHTVVRIAFGDVEGGRVDSVHADRVRGWRHMRCVHSGVRAGARVQEGRDGGQPDVLVRAGGRHAAHVRQRRAVRGAR